MLNKKTTIILTIMIIIASAMANAATTIYLTKDDEIGLGLQPAIPTVCTIEGPCKNQPFDKKLTTTCDFPGKGANGGIIQCAKKTDNTCEQKCIDATPSAQQSTLCQGIDKGVKTTPRCTARGFSENTHTVCDGHGNCITDCEFQNTGWTCQDVPGACPTTGKVTLNGKTYNCKSSLCPGTADIICIGDEITPPTTIQSCDPGCTSEFQCTQLNSGMKCVKDSQLYYSCTKGKITTTTYYTDKDSTKLQPKQSSETDCTTQGGCTDKTESTDVITCNNNANTPAASTQGSCVLTNLKINSELASGGWEAQLEKPEGIAITTPIQKVKFYWVNSKLSAKIEDYVDVKDLCSSQTSNGGSG